MRKGFLILMGNRWKLLNKSDYKLTGILLAPWQVDSSPEPVSQVGLATPREAVAHKSSSSFYLRRLKVGKQSVLIPYFCPSVESPKDRA
jgi:hypothetical protein